MTTDRGRFPYTDFFETMNRITRWLSTFSVLAMSLVLWSCESAPDAMQPEVCASLASAVSLFFYDKEPPVFGFLNRESATLVANLRVQDFEPMFYPVGSEAPVEVVEREDLDLDWGGADRSLRDRRRDGRACRQSQYAQAGSTKANGGTNGAAAAATFDRILHDQNS